MNLTEINNQTLEIKIKPFDSDTVVEEEKYSLNWSAGLPNKTLLKIKMQFKYPPYISREI